MKILSFIQKNLHQPTEIAWEKKRGSPNDFETTKEKQSYLILHLLNKTFPEPPCKNTFGQRGKPS